MSAEWLFNFDAVRGAVVAFAVQESMRAVAVYRPRIGERRVAALPCEHVGDYGRELNSAEREVLTFLLYGGKPELAMSFERGYGGAWAEVPAAFQCPPMEWRKAA